MKRTKLPSRKRRALRRVLFALAALFLANYVLHIGLLFPIQAIRENEELKGTGRTAVVARDWAPEIYKSHLLYLTESENVTMLSGAYLTPLGWMGTFGIPVDCSEDAPLYGGFWSMSREGPSLFYVFGRIDDPEIAYLEVYAEPNESVSQKDVWQSGGFSWGIPRKDWLEKDGQYYFLVRKYPVNSNEYPSGLTFTAVGYDEDNNEVAQVELDQGAYSYFG